MVDAVTSQTLIDGPRTVVMKFTNISDGTGESAVTKVDVSALAGAPSAVVIDEVIYCLSGMTVQILWDADTDVPAILLPDGNDTMCFEHFGGIKNNSGTGKTGDIKFTTSGHSAGDTYTIILRCHKVL